MLSIAFCRRLSGALFLAANIIFVAINFAQTRGANLIVAILFMTCSVAIILSARQHRWLFYAGLGSIVAYALLCTSASGPGRLAQYGGAAIGVFIGVLTLRSALQAETGKQYNLPFPLSLLDTYPLAASSTIGVIANGSIAVGAAMSNDWGLFCFSGLCTIAHGFIIASDIPLRHYLANRQN